MSWSRTGKSISTSSPLLDWRFSRLEKWKCVIHYSLNLTRPSIHLDRHRIRRRIATIHSCLTPKDHFRHHQNRSSYHEMIVQTKKNISSRLFHLAFPLHQFTEMYMDKSLIRRHLYFSLLYLDNSDSSFTFSPRKKIKVITIQ